MRSRYDQLDPEARLVLYLAGELPSEETAQLEETLRRDPQLQSQLAMLRAAQQALNGLGAIDASEPLPVSVSSATRNAIRAIRQRRAEELAHPRPRSQVRRNWSWVLYPAGAVAAVLVIGMFLWSQKKDSNRAPAADLIAGLDDPEAVTSEDEVLYALLPRFRPSRDDEAVALDDSERELDALVTLTNSSFFQQDMTK